MRASTVDVPVISTHVEMNFTPSTPMATPTTAVTRGSPAATSEPRVRARMAKAMTTPTSSAGPPTLVWGFMAVPPYSTSRPAFRAWVMALLRESLAC